MAHALARSGARVPQAAIQGHGKPQKQYFTKFTSSMES